MIYRDIVEIETEKPKDITKDINTVIKNSKINDGFCNVFLQSNSSGFILSDFHPLLIEDMKKLFSQIDEEKIYNHPSACPNMRSMLIKNELTMPIANNELFLGNRQKIIIWNFTKGKRNIVVTISGK